MMTLLLGVLLILVGPFLTGLRGNLAAACLLVVSPLVIGVLLHIEEPAQYDQRNLALGLGLIASGVAVVSWLIGRSIRAIRERDRGPGPTEP
jgi:hypothetical protein